VTRGRALLIQAMSDTSFPILALVRRHAGDAAFYWAQHDAAAHSPRVDLDELARIDRLLAAHLDGLQVAAAEGWRIATQELDRIGGAGETFVCAWLALHSEDTAQLKDACSVAQRTPERCLRGLVSALAWAGQAHAGNWLEYGLEPHAPTALNVAALRALALRPEPIEARLLGLWQRPA
jgi:hypothetical protein